MPDYSQFRVDLNSPQPGGGRGESPRSAFGKHNDLTDAVQADMNKAVSRMGSLVGRDLNSVVEPGQHFCPYTAEATVARHYPTQAAGTLDVTPWDVISGNVIQEYTAIDGSKFYRFNYGGWGEWQRVLKSSPSTIRVPIDGPQGMSVLGTAFQTTIPTALTWLNVVPGESATGSGFHAFGRPVGDSEYLRLACGTGVATITAGRTGSAANNPNIDFSVEPAGLVMRLDNAGAVRLGGAHTPSLSCRLSISFDGGGSRYGIQMVPKVPGDTTFQSFHNSAGVQIGHISSSGAAVYYSTTSDRRAKDEITDAPLENCVNRLLATRVRDYRLMESGARFRGFIADELQEAFREAVLGEPDEMIRMPGMKKAVPKLQSVDLSKLVPDLTGGFQWIHRQVAELAAQVEAQALIIAELSAKLGSGGR
jgi:hypothetical protein